MVAESMYETRSFENTLKTNYHDLHLQEQPFRTPQTGPKGHPKGRGKGKYEQPGRAPRAYYVEVEEDDGGEEEEQYEEYDDEAYEAYADEAEEEDIASDAGGELG